MSRFSLNLLALLLSMTCTHLWADEATRPVTYADGRLSNGIISAVFDKQGAFSMQDARSDEALLSDGRFGLPWGRHGGVEKMYVEDVQDALGAGKRVILEVVDWNELRYQVVPVKRKRDHHAYLPILLC